MKKKYNKLVRDKIPVIIKRDGYIPEICILNGNRFKVELIKKFKEEFREFLKSKDPKELVDIIKVAYMPAEVLGFTEKEFNKILYKKRKERGRLKKRIFNVNELNERIKYSVLVYEDGKIKILQGDMARKYIREHIEEEKIKKEIKELKGQCAYPERTKGKARVIFSSSDLSKMRQGDILISTKTDPSLLPAMKKASAIVTNEGGITCHAAIVARELKNHV
jgi:phosphoenolpyruvate synthase/pyruvate phosphate dikinase